jgi:small subunit ribosomal protein S6
MRTYETIFIVHPESVGDDLNAVIEKYKQILTDQGATVLKIDNWGTRTLAYPVKKQHKGSYILTVFEGQPSIITEFERRMRIDDNVIKFQTVVLEGGYEAPATETAAETADEIEGAEEATAKDESADA